MAHPTSSLTKRSLIGKANSRIVVATSLAAFALVFTAIAGKSLVGQIAYQNRVIKAKHAALTNLQNDIKAVDKLQDSYRLFVSEDPNILAGSAKGSGAQDGDNAKIVLDALPSKYDFPALTTSLEKLITGQNLQILGISGTDEEILQKDKQISTDPKPIPMPFQLQVGGSYASIQSFTDVLLRSIRPFQIQTMELSGDESSMTATFSAQSFYQPEKSLNIETKAVQ